MREDAIICFVLFEMVNVFFFLRCVFAVLKTLTAGSLTLPRHIVRLLYLL